MSDFSKIERRLDKIESTMVTRDEFQAHEDRIMTRMDEMVTILQRLD